MFFVYRTESASSFLCVLFGGCCEGFFKVCAWGLGYLIVKATKARVSQLGEIERAELAHKMQQKPYKCETLQG